MYITDFKYDGVFLSDKGYIPCTFDESSGINVFDTGAKLTFNKVSMRNGKKYGLTSSKYENCVQIVFDICKESDSFYSNQSISNSEYVELMRWLNRKEFHELCIICDYYGDESTEDLCHYNGSFNVDEIKINDILYGLRLTFESDSPFGYSQDKEYTFNFETSETEEYFLDESDDIGYHYPNFIITCNDNGTLIFSNKEAGTRTVINNCVSGEIIKINSDTQTIETNLSDHKIARDFNYIFPVVCNSFENRTNTFTASMPCEVKIVYKRSIRRII